MSEPEAIPATTDTGAPQSEHLAPPEHDPYFVKPDGTKVTGTPRGPDGKFLPKAEAKPAEAEPPKPVEPVGEEPEDADEAKAKPKAKAEPEKKPEDDKPQKIGDAWREVKAQRREVAAREASLQAVQAEIAKEREAIAAERAEMRANFRGWLQKQGLSFRQLVEEDLQEQDADPREKELRELRAEVRRLAEQAEAEQKQKQALTAEQTEAAEVAQVAETIAANAEQFPFLQAYGKDRAAKELHAAWYHHLNTTGEQLDVFTLFEQANTILAQQAAALAPVVMGNGKQAAEAPATAARAESRVGSRAAEEPEAQPEAAPSTLTNRTAAQRASSVSAQLSKDERARAIGNSLLRLRE